MAVTYLDSGTGVSAHQMNALFAEFDRKLAAALGGCSHFIWMINRGLINDPNYDASLIGRPFFFLANPEGAYTQCLRSWGETGGGFSGGSYNHQAFLDALATKTVESWDDAKRIVRVSGYDLPSPRHNCLQPLTLLKPGDASGRPYYVQTHEMVDIPEKHYRYAVAEIIIDGPTELELPLAWNKFECLRFHNLNPHKSVTVTRGPTCGFTLGPLQCRAVRAMREASGDKVFVTWPFRYFFPFVVGDPRFYDCRPNAGLYAAMAANNLSNPALITTWLALFAQRFHFDWSQPAPEVSWATRYGNPGNDATKLGELVHHKGQYVVAQKQTNAPWTFRSFTFHNYAELKTQLSSCGLTVGTGDNGAYSIQERRAGWTTDLISLTTNVFKDLYTPVGMRVVANVNTPLLMESVFLDGGAAPFQTGSLPLELGEELGVGFNGRLLLSEPAATRTYDLWNGETYVSHAVEGFGPAAIVQEVDQADFPANLTLQNTVADAKLNSAGENHSTPQGAFTGIALTYTPLGLTYTWDETVLALEGDLVDAIINRDNLGFTLDLVNQRVQAHRLFIPAERLHGWSRGSQTLGPHVSRVYVTGTSGLNESRELADGQDLDIVVVQGEWLEFRQQQTLVDYTWSGCWLTGTTPQQGVVKAWRAPDWLHALRFESEWYDFWRGHFGEIESRQIMPVLQASQYNLWAWLVNCMAACVPLSLQEIQFTYMYGGVRYYDTIQGLLLPGYRTWQVLPKDGFCGWKINEPAGELALNEAFFTVVCAQLGLTPFTEADLPASYQALVRDRNVPTRHWDRVNGQLSIRTTDSGVAQPLQDTFGPNFRWLKHTQLAAAAVALGLPWHYVQLGVAQALVLLGSPGSEGKAVEHWTEPEYSAGQAEDESANYEDYWGTYAATATFVNATGADDYEWFQGYSSNPGNTIQYHGEQWQYDDTDVLELFGDGSWFIYPEASLAQVNAVQAQSQRLAVRGSSRGAIELRLLLTPQNYWWREKDYLKTHAPPAGMSSDGIDAHRPVEYFSRDVGQEVVWQNVASGHSVGGVFDYSQLLPVPGFHFHVYLQPVVAL